YRFMANRAPLATLVAAAALANVCRSSSCLSVLPTCLPSCNSSPTLSDPVNTLLSHRAAFPIWLLIRGISPIPSVRYPTAASWRAAPPIAPMVKPRFFRNLSDQKLAPPPEKGKAERKGCCVSHLV